MQDRFFTNQDTLLTNQELAALQLSKDVNQYNTIIEDIKKLRGGAYPRDFYSILNTHQCKNKFTLQSIKAIQFDGGSINRLNFNPFIKDDNGDIIVATLEALKELVPNLDPKEYARSEFTEASKIISGFPSEHLITDTSGKPRLSFVDEIILNHWIKNDISMLGKESLKHLIPYLNTEQLDEYNKVTKTDNGENKTHKFRLK